MADKEDNGIRFMPEKGLKAMFRAIQLDKDIQKCKALHALQQSPNSLNPKTAEKIREKQEKQYDLTLSRLRGLLDSLKEVEKGTLQDMKDLNPDEAPKLDDGVTIQGSYKYIEDYIKYVEELKADMIQPPKS